MMKDKAFNIHSESSHFPAPSLQLAVTQFVNKTYLWMCLGLLLTAVISTAVLSSEGLINIILNTPGVLIGILLAQLGLIFVMNMLMKNSNTSAHFLTLCFIIYSVMSGLTFSSIGLIYTVESISQTFFIASGMFGALAIFGSITKRDLSPLGSFFGMGLIGMILLGLLNLFFQSESLSLGIATAGIFVFAGLTAYDAQVIRSLAYTHIQNGDSKTEQKAIIMGALILYLDFINLFLNLLKLMGKKRR